MVTDIHLEWNGKTKEDEEKQITGWSINAGDKGYLCAAIWMDLENWLLKQIFSEEYWSGRKRRYKFTEKKLQTLEKIGRDYLVAKLEGIKPPEAEEDKLMKRAIRTIGVLGSDVQKDHYIARTAMWLNSVFQFFKLGIELEEQGKSPKVEISW